MKKRFASAAIALLTTAVASAAPTPLPGGANQLSAVTGTLGETVWNGAVRLTLVHLRDATPDETAKIDPGAGKKVMAYEVRVRNGLHDAFQELLGYTLADKDDVAVSIPYVNPVNIVQGAAAVQKDFVRVDADFVPVKMIVECRTCSSHSPFKTIRLTIPATPAAPSNE